LFAAAFPTAECRRENTKWKREREREREREKERERRWYERREVKAA
jgi:hypothetical protein